jgi:hypothetical protein
VDLDLNGSTDAITIHREDGNPIWLNDGTATFTAAGSSLDEPNVLVVSAADVDGDKKPDLFVGKLDGYGGNKLYFNRTVVPTRPFSWGRIKTLFERE